MEILYLLIAISVPLLMLIMGILWWSIRSGQYDDMEWPAHSILLDDDSPQPKAGESKPHQD